MTIVNALASVAVRDLTESSQWYERITSSPSGRASAPAR